MFDKNNFGKSFHKENVSLFNDVNDDSGSDMYLDGHLSLLREKNFNRLFFAHISINSISNNFDPLIHGNIF